MKIPVRWLNRVVAALFATALLYGPANIAQAQTTATWLSPTSGDWTDPSMWSIDPYYPDNGQPSGTTYDALIDATGSAYTVNLANDISLDGFTLNSSDATINHTGGILQVGGNGLVINAGAYKLAGGEISNTRISGSGSFVIDATAANNRLNDVTFAGTANYSGTGNPQDVSVSGGLHFDAGLLNIQSGTLEMAGNQAITGNGEIDIHGSGQIGAWDPSYSVPLTTQLTIDSGMLIRAVSGGSGILASTGALTNHGTIRSESGGAFGGMHLVGTNVVNDGLIESTSNTVLSIENLDNQGQVRIGAGTRFMLSGQLINAGDLQAENAHIQFYANTTSDQVSTLDTTGSDVHVFGRIDNTGRTLDLAQLAGQWTFERDTPAATGTIVGGVIDSSATIPTTHVFQGGAIENATLAGALKLAGGDTLHLVGTLTLNGGSVQMTGTDGTTASSYAEMSSEHDATIAGDGQISFGGGGNLSGNQVGARSGTLTVGSGVTVQADGGGGTVGFAGQGLVNRGTIRATGSGNSVDVTGNGWLNTGLLEATNGGALYLSGSTTTHDLGAWHSDSASHVYVDAMIDNTGNTLQIDDTTGPMTLLSHRNLGAGAPIGTIKGGRIVIQGSANLGGSGILDGVTISGNAQFDTDTRFGGMTIKNSLTLDNAQLSGLVSFDGAGQTISGTGQIQLAGSSSSFPNVVTHDGLTIGNNVTISLASGKSNISGNNHALLINHGTIEAKSNPNSNLTIADNWQSDGYLRADGTYASLQLQGTGTSTGTIEAINGGWVDLSGNWSNAGGRLDVAGVGSLITLEGNFSTADLGNFSNEGGTLEIAGTMDNSGATFALNDTTGTVDLRGGTVSGGIIDGLTGGHLQIDYGTLQNTQIDGLVTCVSVTGAQLVGTTVINGTLHVDHSRLVTSDGATLDGSGEILLTGANSGQQALLYSNSGQQFTINSGLTVRATGWATIGARASSIHL